MVRKNAVRLWAVVFWLVVWQLGSMAFGQTLLLPSPLAVLLRLASLAATVEFWSAVGWSAARILGGFALSCLAAVLLAVPAVPVASFIILALVWLNSRQLSLFIAGLMVFPTVYTNVLTGIGQTDPKLLEMARVFRVPLARQVTGIYLPAILPYFRAACSLSLGLCWKAGIAAEVIGLPGGSLGERLYTAKVYFQTEDLFAWTAVIVAVSLIFERLFLRAVNALAERLGSL